MVLDQPGDKLRVIGLVGDELASVGKITANCFALNGGLLDLALVHVLNELAVVESGRVRLVRRRLEEIEQEDEQRRDDDPQQQISKVVQEAVLSVGANAASRRDCSL